MGVKLNLIVAVSENMGIGKNGDLPWRLRNEMAHFSRLTTKTNDPSRKNVVLMGRLTWDSIPAKFKPLPNRINFVLTKSNLDFSSYENAHKFDSLQSAIDALESDKYKALVENVWVIGGASVYKEALLSKYFYRLYLTKVQKSFDCDTFFPSLPENLKEISEANVPTEQQEEKGITYSYHVYENISEAV
ncbi:dihydrofolate reductase-like [Rhynchophorus ferrugineus]|uniref:dihydrofolate reductase-like n=1 Tax=Rhynchophorus ferrugineus TaxID=354439 RepID=UPI003FCC8AA3